MNSPGKRLLSNGLPRFTCPDSVLGPVSDRPSVRLGWPFSRFGHWSLGRLLMVWRHDLDARHHRLILRQHLGHLLVQFVQTAKKVVVAGVEVQEEVKLSSRAIHGGGPPKTCSQDGRILLGIGPAGAENPVKTLRPHPTLVAGAPPPGVSANPAFGETEWVLLLCLPRKAASERPRPSFYLRSMGVPPRSCLAVEGLSVLRNDGNHAGTSYLTWLSADL